MCSLKEVTSVFRPRYGSLELIDLVLESLAMRLLHAEPTVPLPTSPLRSAAKHGRSSDAPVQQSCRRANLPVSLPRSPLNRESFYTRNAARHKGTPVGERAQ